MIKYSLFLLLPFLTSCQNESEIKLEPVVEEPVKKKKSLNIKPIKGLLEFLTLKVIC